MPLDTFEQQFILEYLKDLNGRAAARRAGAQGTDASQASRAFRTLQKEEVQEALAAAFAERNKRAQIDADTVLREIHAIATADTNDLVEYRRACCRHCWGADFGYQYASEREMRKAQREFDNSDASLVEDFKHGGLGFDARRDPNHECPECSGEGNGYVHIKDTRYLSPGARALYAGAKVTKEGVEIKLHDKVKNLELLARHLGLLNDKLEVKGDITLAKRILDSRKRVDG